MVQLLKNKIIARILSHSCAEMRKHKGQWINFIAKVRKLHVIFSKTGIQKLTLILNFCLRGNHIFLQENSRRNQQSDRSFFKKIKKFIIGSLILISPITYAGTGYLSNGFFITNRTHEFDKITKSGKCSKIIEYPEVYREDSKIITHLNNAIKAFVETYNSCDIENSKITKYEINEGSLDYFSIRWITTNLKQIPVEINSLNFAKSNGHLLTIEDILNPLAKNFLPEFVKLSENHLAADISWTQFLDKVEQKYIQFHIINSKWHIVFNPHQGINVSVVEKELPNYLLKS